MVKHTLRSSSFSFRFPFLRRISGVGYLLCCIVLEFHTHSIWLLLLLFNKCCTMEEKQSINPFCCVTLTEWMWNFVKCVRRIAQTIQIFQREGGGGTTVWEQLTSHKVEEYTSKGEFESETAKIDSSFDGWLPSLGTWRIWTRRGCWSFVSWHRRGESTSNSGCIQSLACQQRACHSSTSLCCNRHLHHHHHLYPKHLCQHVANWLEAVLFVCCHLNHYLRTLFSPHHCWMMEFLT